MNMIDRLLELSDDVRSIASSYKPYVELDRKEFLVFSDIHGSLEAARLVSELSKEHKVIVLGDYTGRIGMNARSVETLIILFEAFLNNDVMLLRGNHEDRSIHHNPISTFLKELAAITDEYEKVDEELLKTFRELPLVAIAEDTMMMHGGIPVKHLSPDSFLERLIKPEHACMEPYYEVLRNIPKQHDRKGLRVPCIDGTRYSHAFGPEEARRAMEAYGLKRIIVGHTHPLEGFKEFFGGVYAVLSSYVTPDVERRAYLRVGKRIEAIYF